MGSQIYDQNMDHSSPEVTYCILAGSCAVFFFLCETTELFQTDKRFTGSFQREVHVQRRMAYHLQSRFTSRRQNTGSKLSLINIYGPLQRCGQWSLEMSLDAEKELLTEYKFFFGVLLSKVRKVYFCLKHMAQAKKTCSTNFSRRNKSNYRPM
jgi:hypothetical protein